MAGAAEAPFVVVDCASATPQDLEHELFGFVAQRRADGNDERRSAERITRHSSSSKPRAARCSCMNVAEIPTRVQGKLHRVLRDREAVLSADRSASSSTSGRSRAVEPGFESVLEEGRLRRDLYERLSLIRIELPPLRQRREDVPFLATHFLKEICRLNGAPIKTLTRPALTLLAALPWRSNAPELRALLERLVLLTPHGSIRLEDVLAQVRLDGSEIAAVGRDDPPGRAAPVRARLHRGCRPATPRPDGRGRGVARDPAHQLVSQAETAQRVTARERWS